MKHFIALKKSESYKIYFGLILTLVLVRLLFLFLPATVNLPPQSGQVNWLFIIVFGLLGFLGLKLSRSVGFPEMQESEISNQQRFLIPALIGLAIGLITVIEDVVNPSAKIVSPLFVRFPLFIYGAIAVEIFLRLFLLSFIVWVLSFIFKGQRSISTAFWIAAVFVSLFESLLFFADAGVVGVGGIIVVFRLFAANLIAAYLFRKSGFIAPLVMRFFDYFIWHIIWQG
jgi:hypothetical protein